MYSMILLATLATGPDVSAGPLGLTNVHLTRGDCTSIQAKSQVQAGCKGQAQATQLFVPVPATLPLPMTKVETTTKVTKTFIEAPTLVKRKLLFRCR